MYFFRQNKMFYKIWSFLEQTLLQEISVPKEKKEGPQHYENKRIWNFWKTFFVTKTPQESISFYGSQGFLFTLPFPLHMAHFYVYITSYTEVRRQDAPKTKKKVIE